ncbi:TauD/TfdA family dioxygenase [Amycolatopsis sp. OK19-0408]|uniref:TauD/TfdA family dioxygenase n=1 Tax=Amycolatopsis iheyensis TaxID=2945988 RepID=A0A9X2SMN1_9PSEU|nr:TauD/TfdA family dioxygenase [Amycolatopsis iheyensis]MCR6485755.1 TauD/TfdA family dioxygenase [Amycolatopsis iheyensis]
MTDEKLSHGGTTLTVLSATRAELPDRRAEIEAACLRDGAVVVRGLGVAEPADLHEVVSGFGAPLDSYRGGNTPRKSLADGVFTSTEYPAQFEISLHNELSYAAAAPRRLYFACLLAAETGGATPVCDGRALLADLEPAVRHRFEDKGVRYHQLLHGGHGFGKSWQETFESDDRAVVESFLAASRATWSWTREGGLRVAQNRPGVRRHPETGEPAWFNQAEQWHPSSLPAEAAEAMLALAGVEEDLPQWVTYGDGTRIPDADLAQVRAAAERNKLVRPWRAGEVLFVDNVLALHGRSPYTGRRRVTVAMT